MAEHSKSEGQDHTHTDHALPAPAPVKELGYTPTQLLSESASAEKAGPPDVVVFKNVTKSFGRGPDAKIAIQDISFVV